MGEQPEISGQNNSAEAEIELIDGHPGDQLVVEVPDKLVSDVDDQQDMALRVKILKELYQNDVYEMDKNFQKCYF